MNKLRTLYHRWQAASIRRRKAADQLALDEYIATEQTRLSIMDNRAEWHERQARPVGKGIAALIPLPGGKQEAA